MSDERDPPDGARLPMRAEQRWLPATSPTPWSPHATMRGVGGGDCTVTAAVGSDVLGWSRADLVAVLADDLVHPDDRDGLSELAARVRAAGSRFMPVQLRLLARDRRYWWTRWHCWLTADRSTITATGVDYVAPTGELGPPVGLWWWDVDTDVVSWTTELLDMFALTVGPPTSYRAFLDGVLDDDRDDVAQAIDDALVTGEPYVISFRCPTAGHRDRWFHATGRRLPTTGGRPRRVGGMVKYLNPPAAAGERGVIGCG